MTKKAIRAAYRKWRKENNNAKPNRAVVHMKWEDGDNTDKGWQQDTVALDAFWNRTREVLFPSDDCEILYYCDGLEGLCDLAHPGNGSEFVVINVVDFYKHVEPKASKAA